MSRASKGQPSGRRIRGAPTLLALPGMLALVAMLGAFLSLDAAPAPASPAGGPRLGAVSLAGPLAGGGTIHTTLTTGPPGTPTSGTVTAATTDASSGSAGERSRALRRRLRAASGISLEPSTTGPWWACPEGACEAIVDPSPVAVESRGRPAFALPADGPTLEGGGEKGGYDPEDLQSAYSIPSGGGAGQTIAVIDAYGFGSAPAEAQLAKYRTKYGLPPCTVASGCLRQVNGDGEEGSYPPADAGWEVETALDLDMASAACPDCHIMLVEAEGEEPSQMAHAVETAATLGATEISNSYAYFESYEPWCGSDHCQSFSAAYDHPGVLVTAAAGDYGYENDLNGSLSPGASSPGFPASSPYVTAVGGTALRRASNARGWREEAWASPAEGVGGGGGCSRSEPKPAWQPDTGCPGRTDDDVAAVASCQTPVSIYLRLSGYKGWLDVCGTSAASPLVAGIEAHASAFSRSLGAEAFYLDPAALFDVTEASNTATEEECAPPAELEYLCVAGPGYDGPTGNGSPDGPLDLLTAAPLARTGPASALVGGSATLEGTIDPNGAPTSYRFEYGASPSYGASVPAGEGDAGEGTSEEHLSAGVSGVQAGTTYHYRLVASSPAGVSYGADETFTGEPPSVSGVEPVGGPDAGRTSVTITGTALAGATAVRFGGRPALAFRALPGGTIRAVSPEGTGTGDVTVTTPSGTSATTPADRFSYQLGTVLGWGLADGGQLGDGSTADADVPVETHASQAAELAAGNAFALALEPDGTVRAWGEGFYGQLGDGTEGEVTSHSVRLVNAYTPVAVCAVGVEGECPHGPYLEDVTAVAAGVADSLALLRDGTVVSWGSDYEGQLGAGARPQGSTLPQETSDVPEHVCGVAESPCTPEHWLREVVAIAAGGWHNLALLADGRVVAWGLNEEGQLGDGTHTGPEKGCDEGFYPCSFVPLPVEGLGEASAIQTGRNTSLALLRDGTVRAWGENDDGELGDGTVEQRDRPVAVCAQAEQAPCTALLEGVREVGAGGDFTAALLDGGTVETWGDAFEGQLGDGSFAGYPRACGGNPCTSTPVTVKDLQGVTSIAVGSSMVFATLADGGVAAWGGDRYGTLGDGNAEQVPPGKGMTFHDEPTSLCAAYAEAPCPEGSLEPGRSVTSLSVGGDFALLGLSNAPGPHVSSVSPSDGPVGGGGTVTIDGTGLGAVGTVRFGGVPASGLHVLSGERLTVTAPPGRGTVDVTASDEEGTSPALAGDQFTYEGPPAVAAGASQDLGQRAATLTAEVDPEDATVSECRFEYGTSPSYGESVPCETLPGGGGSPVTVSAAVAGLAPGTPYHFRLLAANPEGASDGPDATFTTVPAEPPTASTTSTSLVGEQAATLGGSVDPEGEALTGCRFEYGPDGSYDASVPCASTPAAGTAAVPVSATVTGLAPGSVYDYRLVAATVDGTSYGSAVSFTTGAAALPEIGLCTKLPAKTGIFRTSGCTSATRHRTGGYEWSPWPLSENVFSGGGTSVVLESAGARVECASIRAGGEYTGAQSATESIELGSCQGSGALTGSCASATAVTGEIRTGPLLARVGLASGGEGHAGSAPAVGWELAAPPGDPLASFNCGETAVTLTGAVTGGLTTTDRDEKELKLAFEVVAGKQLPEGLEGASPDGLALEIGGTREPALLSGASTLAGPARVEVRALD